MVWDLMNAQQRLSSSYPCQSDRHTFKSSVIRRFEWDRFLLSYLTRVIRVETSFGSFQFFSGGCYFDSFVGKKHELMKGMREDFIIFMQPQSASFFLNANSIRIADVINDRHGYFSKKKKIGLLNAQSNFNGSIGIELSPID